MKDKDTPTTSSSPDEFQRAAADQRVGLAAEFWDFLKHNKKWWLLPILLCLAGLIALLVIASVGGGAATPFIYTIF